MKRLILLPFLCLVLPSISSAREAWRGWCEESGHVITSGLTSTTTVQVSHTSCLVSVYIHGGGLAILYSDNNGTPMANPFTAQTGGMWTFYANNGRVDVTTTSAGFSQPVTYSDILLCDPADVGSSCAGGGGGGGLITIYKNNTLVGIEPGIDFVEGTNISILPATDDPANTRVHLTFNSVEQVANNGSFVGAEQRINFIPGTNVTYTMADNTGATPPRVDVTINAAGGGGGCTLPSHDTAVLSEHPAGTCYDSTHFTWDDTAFNLQVANATNTNTSGTENTFLIGPGNNASGAGETYALGDFNNLQSGLGTFAKVFAVGSGNRAVQEVGNSITVLFGSNQVGSAANAGSGGHDVWALGLNNTIYQGQFVSPIGYNNALGIPASTGVENLGSVHGYLNDVNVNGTFLGHTGDGSTIVSEFGIWGDFNEIGGESSGSGRISNAYIYGFTNHINSWNGSVGGGFIYGFDNNIEAAAGGDENIFGASNTVVSNQADYDIGANDNVIFGALNTSTNAGGKVIVGMQNDVSQCTTCAAIGYNVQQRTSNSVMLGISNTPELTITTGNVRRAPIGMSSGPLVNATKVFPNGTITGSIGQTCNVAFTGGAGSGGTGTLYLSQANSGAGALLVIVNSGSYTLSPTGGTLTNGTATCSSTIGVDSTVGLVPTCSATTEGSFTPVVDSTTNTWGATITGGGANHVLGYCDGTNWTVAAK